MKKHVPKPRIRVAAIIVQEDRVLLVQHTKPGESYWMLPGGGVDFGESLADALAREVREELRIEIEVQDLVLASDAITPGRERHIVNLCFIARILSGTPALGEDTRITDFAFMSIDELPRVPFFPPYAAELCALIRAQFPQRARYCGNLWKEFEA